MVQKNIKLYSPSVGKKELKNIEEVIKYGILTKGKFVKEFENKLKELTDRKYAVLFNSGTSALFAAYFSLNVNNKKILIPDYTFPGTAVPALFYKAKISLAEIDPETYNINPSIIDSSFDIVVCVDQFGMPCDYNKIYKLKQRYGFTLIEDSACAIGSSYRGKQCGNFGEISIFSFHPRKLITTGEGGVLLTDDYKIYKKAKSLKDHNIEKEDITLPGFNFRMSDINAAIGMSQIQKLQTILQKRKKIFTVYKNKLKNYVKFQKQIKGAKPNYQSFVITTKIPTKILIKKLKEKRINSVKGNYSLSKLSIFRNFEFRGDKTISQRLSEYSIALPIHQKMSEQEAAYVSETLIQIIKGF